MAYAIFKTGGKQYRVQKGDVIDVERLPLDAGASHSFNQVLFVLDGAGPKIGDPVLDGAKVNATVVDQVRADKVTAFKYRRRKGYHRTRGHRRQMTRLEITGFSA